MFGVSLATVLIIAPAMPPLGQVVGAFYRVGALVRDTKDFAIALIAFTLLMAARWPALAIVVLCVVASLLRMVWT